MSIVVNGQADDDRFDLVLVNECAVMPCILGEIAALIKLQRRSDLRRGSLTAAPTRLVPKSRPRRRAPWERLIIVV